MSLQLRPATLPDLPAIATLMNRAYRGTGLLPGESPGWATEIPYITGDRTTSTALAADLAANPHAHLLVSGSPLDATVWLEPLTATLWYLGSLTVASALQSSGLGSRLLTAAEHFAAARGARTIHITVVNVRSTLIAWYQRRGYILTGHTEPFPYGDTRFGTPLVPGLHFVALEKSVKELPTTERP